MTGKLLTLDRALEPACRRSGAARRPGRRMPRGRRLDPPQRRQRTLDAVKRLLLRESQVQPLLLVFEDLHWIDAETQALLDSLVESLPTARVLLLVNYRPEYQHALGQQDLLPPAPDRPAAAGERRGAARRAARGRRGLRPLKRLLIERTEGNPFFLEESVRTLVETGLVGERGAYRLAQPSRRSQVPATVQAVLAARIDRLPPEDKRLLQAAAVIGKDVPFALLQAIAEQAETSCAGASRSSRPPSSSTRRALSRSRVHLQARADPRGRLREPAPGAAARAPRADRGGDRAALSATVWPSTSSAWRTTPFGASCGARPSTTCVRPAQGVGALGAPRGGGRLRAGARGLRASA